MARSSRLSGFYNLPPAERRRIVAEWAALSPEQVTASKNFWAARRLDAGTGRQDGGERGRHLRAAAWHRHQLPGQRPRCAGADGHRGAVGGGGRQLRGPAGAGGRRLSRRDDRAADDRPDAGARRAGSSRGSRAEYLAQKQRLLDLANSTDPVDRQPGRRRARHRSARLCTTARSARCWSCT